MAKDNINYIETINILYTTYIQIINELDINNIISEIDLIFKKIKIILLGISYLNEFNKKTSDMLLAFGEKISCLIISTFITLEINQNQNLNIITIYSGSYIVTDSNFGNANVLFKETQIKLNKIKETDYNIIITSGFISMTENEEQTTLGRCGGDYTAAIFGSILNATRVEIWTDVDGIMTSDPKIVPTSETIDKISYNEIIELSHYGANIIYTPTIFPLYKDKIPIIVKNTFKPDLNGTIINFEKNKTNKIATAISNIKNISLIKVYGNYLIGKIGFSGKLFSLFSNNMINIIMISQSSSEHSIYIVINEIDSDKAKYNLEKVYIEHIKNKEIIVEIKNNKSVIAIETNNFNNILDISAKIYPIFKKYNIPIYTQNTSDHNVSLVIDRHNLISIQNILHDDIFGHIKYINVIIIGNGLVGKELINQLQKHKNIIIIGIANSKKIIYDNNIECSYNLSNIINNFIDLKVSNKVFVDCTSCDTIYPYYLKLLDNNISVVTPNKKANTTHISLFNKLKLYNNYKFETTVGAGLPIINTIKKLINNGDKIIKIEAILSGTLSYIFNTFSESDDTFLNIVIKAQDLGYTEPNPKDDLNGLDVVRKILIISRLLGLDMEMYDILNKPFLSDECLKSDNTNDFFKHLG